MVSLLLHGYKTIIKLNLLHILTDEAVHALSLRQCDRILTNRWLSDEVCSLDLRIHNNYHNYSFALSDSSLLLDFDMQRCKKGSIYTTINNLITNPCANIFFENVCLHLAYKKIIVCLFYMQNQTCIIYLTCVLSYM